MQVDNIIASAPQIVNPSTSSGELTPSPLTEKPDIRPEPSQMIPDGLLLVLLTAGAYLGAYVFEFGYLIEFGIPPELIEVTISTLVATGGALLLMSALFGQIVHLLWLMDGDGVFRPENGLGSFLKKWWIFILTVVAGIFLFDPPWYAWLPTSIWILLMIADLVVPILDNKSTGTYGKRLSDWLARDAQDNEERASRRSLFKTRFVGRFGVTVMLLALFTATCSFLGHMSAKTRSSFAFVDSSEENVILRRYGDRYILSKYDWQTQQFVKQFRFVDVSSITTPIVWREMPHWTVQVRKEPPSPPHVFSTVVPTSTVSRSQPNASDPSDAGTNGDPLAPAEKIGAEGSGVRVVFALPSDPE